MYRKYLKFIAYFKKYNIIENIFLLMSVISVVFIAYIASFNFASLVLVGTGTVAKFVLNLTFTYILVSTLVTVIYTVFEYTMPLFAYKSEHDNVITKFKHPLTKHIIKLIIFLWAYLGFFTALSTIETVVVFFMLIIFMDILIYPKYFIEGTRLPDLKKITKEYFENKKYLDVIKKYFGVFILFLALMVGMSRAQYVKKFSLITLNDKKGTYVLYMNTDYGIGLWQPQDSITSFVAWGNVKNITFLSNTNKIFSAN